MPELTLPATRIHYLQAGAGGLPIVFVHGALCTHADWRFQWPHFAQRRLVLAPDLHGHGASAPEPARIGVACFADDLVALLDAHHIPKAVLVGHSMGCRAVLQTWRIAPQRVAGMVFVDGAYLAPGLLGPRSPADRARQADEARARAAAVYQDVEPAVRARHGFAQMFYDPQFNHLRDEIVQRAAALPGHVARTLMPDFAVWDLLHMEDVLPTITVPTLAIACTFMNSQRERISLQPGIETPWLQALAQLAPQAEVQRWFGGGHFPMLEQPERTNAAIDAFLQRHGLDR